MEDKRLERLYDFSEPVTCAYPLLARTCIRPKGDLRDWELPTVQRPLNYRTLISTLLRKLTFSRCRRAKQNGTDRCRLMRFKAITRACDDVLLVGQLDQRP